MYILCGFSNVNRFNISVSDLYLQQNSNKQHGVLVTHLPMILHDVKVVMMCPMIVCPSTEMLVHGAPIRSCQQNAIKSEPILKCTDHSVLISKRIIQKFGDTSANEDNSFRNHIRQPKHDFPQVSIENRLIHSGCCPLFKQKFYKIVISTL